MTVPYSLNRNQDDDFYITIITHNKSLKPLIRFNLNMIECSNKNSLLNWTSLESSSTLHGEFLRTSFIDKNLMYLQSGNTYLKNLTAIDCLTKTMYRTDEQELFQLDLRIESTLNDYCSNENLCYPEENYQCNLIKHRCICRQPLQSYSIKESFSICVQAVDNIDQCTMINKRCLQWCHQNNSTAKCLCPKEISKKKISYNNQAYCESRTGGICNSFIQCPLENLCIHGTCQHINNEFYQSVSMNIATISIIVSCLIIFMISAILGIGIYILRRQRWKKHYHSPISSVCAKQQQMTVPAISDYDNITYGAFRANIQLSSSDDNDSSPMTTSDDCSYEPKIVYLGGEQQLTAIFA
ncbi:unnamed protein product [Adineta steineri]|uniref:EB domain-containing protein n=1 Tax=Adineta steineri TaxID=433720 RepID=A0A818T6L5_9BILA|nr:unnamed protein product [Adineta steineri]CAF3682741.1 unnamed protein product [Adineta steineri]